MYYFQAILSQFSRKVKSTSANTDNYEGDADNKLYMLEQELQSGDGVGDEDPVLDNDQDSDNIAADVVASDSEAIDAIIADDEQDNIRLDALSTAEANLGRLSIAKVIAYDCSSLFNSLY